MLIVLTEIIAINFWFLEIIVINHYCVIVLNRWPDLLLYLTAITHCATLSVFEHQVCELDIIFNFEKAYYILDEFILGGEAQETSKKNVLKAIEQADMLQEVRNTHILLFLYFCSTWSDNWVFSNCWMNFLWFLPLSGSRDTT